MAIRSVREIRKGEIPAGIRCIALDLDGTLLDSAGTMSDYTRCVLDRAIASGICVVVSSGRPFSAFPHEITVYDGIEYAIASNGVSIHHLPTNQCLHRTVMDAESVERLVQLYDAYDFLLEAHILGKSYASEEYFRNPAAFGIGPRGVVYIQSTRTPIEHMREFLLNHRHELDGMRIICRDNETASDIQEQLQEDSRIYVTSEVGKRLMEICHRDCGKHNGLSWLLNDLQISRESTVAFGNAENDADMLRFAEIGIAVSNSSLSCLEAADYITDSNDEDGVAHAICHLLSL